MAVTILIPTALRQFTDSLSEVDVDAQNVREALEKLAEKYADLQRHLFTEKKTLRSFVNVYVNEVDIRQIDRLDTVLKDNDTVMLVPSIAGGASVIFKEDIHG